MKNNFRVFVLFCSSVGLKNILKSKVDYLVNSQLCWASSSPWKITSETWLLSIPIGKNSCYAVFLLAFTKIAFKLL